MRQDRVAYDHLTSRQHSLVIGTMLGDGHIEPKKGTANSRLCLVHGESQREYMLWKTSELTPLFTESDPTVVKRQTSTAFLTKHSRRHPLWQTYRELFYSRPDSECSKHVLKKRITREILDQVDELAFVVWFLDDGGYHQKVWGKGSLYLIVGGVSEAEYDLVDVWLKEQHHEFSRYPRPERHLTVYEFKTTYAKGLAERMAQHVPSSMSYKLRNI